ncbi:hypothetical protein CM15mP37_10800 [bacterium]|nr:MAG: hypothetical protein CM15mP37_10800 [bacterium]
MIFPFYNAAINNPNISYALSGNCFWGRYLDQIDGAQDLSPHNVEMVGGVKPQEKKFE